jgi:DNA-binding transcriptional LysR family regulator
MDGRDVLEADALRAFAVFAEHRSFTAAAAALHISQPSLHVKIRKLGRALGVDLYERDGRRLTLTAAGEQLAGYAQEHRRRLDVFLRDLHQELPVLTVATGRGALRWVVAEPIRRFGGRGRTVRILTADRDHALAAVSTGQADVAVLADDPPPSRYQRLQIAAFPQNLVVDARHPLAARTRLTRTALNGLDLVVPSPERARRRALDRALADASVRWRVAAEVDGWDLMVHLAALGMGATIVNGCVTPPAGLTAIPITDLPRIRYWAAWRPSRRDLVADLVDQFRRTNTPTGPRTRPTRRTRRPVTD